MGRTNYSKMSTQKIKEQEEPVIATGPIVAEAEVDEECAACAISVNEPDVIEEPTAALGNVQNCVRLNVRAKPDTNAAVLEVIEAGTDVDVDKKSLGKPWYKVTTIKGTVGYCMKEYIVII